MIELVPRESRNGCRQKAGSRIKIQNPGTNWAVRPGQSSDAYQPRATREKPRHQKSTSHSIQRAPTRKELTDRAQEPYRGRRFALPPDSISLRPIYAMVHDVLHPRATQDGSLTSHLRFMLSQFQLSAFPRSASSIRFSTSERKSETDWDNSAVRPGASPSQNGMFGGCPWASSTRTCPEFTRRI